MRWLLRAIMTWIEEWRRRKYERIQEEVRIKDGAQESLDRIDSLTQELASSQENRRKAAELSERRKSLGLSWVLLLLLLPSTVFGQDYKTRVETMSHEELKAYTLTMAQLVLEQEALITKLQLENEQYAMRMVDIGKEVSSLKEAVEKLSFQPKSSKLSTFFNWSLRLAPIILSAVTVGK